MVKKIPLEIYSRIVGYFRPLNNWNNGKKEEFKDRLEYVEEKAVKDEFETKVIVRTNGKQESATVNSYKIFTLPTCEKCAEAKKYLNDFSIVGEHFDLSSKEGLDVFREYYRNLKGVIKRDSDGRLPVPTVLFFDDKNNMVGNAHTIDEVKKFV